MCDLAVYSVLPIQCLIRKSEVLLLFYEVVPTTLLLAGEGPLMLSNLIVDTHHFEIIPLSWLWKAVPDSPIAVHHQLASNEQ